MNERTFRSPEVSGRPIVYIREIAVADLPPEVREAGAGTRKKLYAIGSEDGQQLALVDDRKLAFVVARQHEHGTGERPLTPRTSEFTAGGAFGRPFRAPGPPFLRQDRLRSVAAVPLGHSKIRCGFRQFPVSSRQRFTMG